MDIVLVSVSKLSKTIGEKKLFSNLDFSISEGEKLAIVGINGSGKSTLLRALLGKEETDSGQIIKNNNLKISILDQNPVFDQNETILDHIYKGDNKLVKTIRRYEDICERMGEGEEGLDDEFTSASQEMDRLSAWDYEQQIKSILKELGVEKLERKMSELSGGMLKKVELAKSLIDESNLLILDEPTNHLDVKSILWLEDYLAGLDKAILLITHDRYFLDRIVTKILELDRGNHFLYEGNYSIYLERKVEREETLQKQEDKIKQFLKQEVKWLKRQPKARTTKQKARIDRASDLQNREKREIQKDLELSVAAKRQGKTILEIHNLKKGIGDRLLINDFTYTFKAKERLGIIGPNGIGKSTLLNLMAGRIAPDSGFIKPGMNTKVGYFDQTSSELPLERNVLDYIKDVAGEMIETESGEKISAAKMLERFLFDGKLQYTPIAKLSGGERRRLFLVQILMTGPNFLILDEPTNDLDIQTLSVLESFLDEFPGTVVIVSHDRYFLDRTAESLLIFRKEGKLDHYIGTFSSFLETDSLELENEQSSPKPKESSPATLVTDKPQKSKQDQKKLSKLELEIAKLESSKQELEKKLSTFANNHTELQKISEEIQKIETEILYKMEEWEMLQSE
ncbi:ABC-F family ATP-binding cassette domain-containing protein [Leptospira sp. 2 VSF19]|uniref:ABC-F family ATP-binding cassette domain-containing protein n=1 Tax=Leptospira soteropolitanensis TaxID=2950025 RepID=A0AAW5VTD8_9LEPT|nr:ABC-F family ATP-binding cassette domain-containing protein [Leptospira soteropolitanensis]MCW7494384.1 ABC-F family ATP-binding cassette domain-containing protein [Leptospira soteropolitanensis]MCW7501907.1 ABC-F family ATP-binding cassette domain-containing protein [Leptospira soteropolitanensis]MCW7524230.1 ABC-F family ATP-binding cassette domain-containing protein [Leptospira soteropolitanensis]MCW7528095.1 ABC-F family ATP-binding cassette domain-containing protein [Leptospira soteropo